MKRETVGVKVERVDRSGRRLASEVTDRENCRVWPRRSAEGEEGRVVLSGWNVHFPTSEPIPANAILVVRGKDYALFGNVADYGPKGMIAQCRSAGQQ